MVPRFAPAQIAPPTVTVPPIMVPLPPQVGPQVEINVAPPLDTAPAPAAPAAPLLDGVGEAEELPPSDAKEDYLQRRGVRPYGGGHPTDWSWGCAGSPYRTDGRCDNWKVGCDWQVTVDGIVMTREHSDLEALVIATNADSEGTPIFDPLDPLDPNDPALEQFDHGPGGRITFISQAPHYVGYQVHFAYEGIEEWNASVVYPKQPLDVGPFTFPPQTQPPLPFPEGTEQRSLHYRSSLHSGELNFVRHNDPVWRPFCGVRYIKFDDEINDFIDQQAQPPLPGPRADVNPIGPVTTTDRLNLFDIENNLIGFQIGFLHDTWRVNRRFALEGFVNSGVYYNKIKFTNLMGTFTTQEFADNTTTLDDNEARIDFSDTVNNDVRELSEISYVAEASLSGVCRLNKCWALRAGYQVLWINNLHLADDAFLDTGVDDRSLFFHGWHAGVECRR